MDTMQPIRDALKVCNLKQVERDTKITSRQLINIRDGVTMWPRLNTVETLRAYFKHKA